MKIKVQDLKPGMRVRTAVGTVITLETVKVFDDAKSKVSIIGRPTMYLPGCVLVTWNEGHEHFTFRLDETVERVFLSE